MKGINCTKSGLFSGCNRPSGGSVSRDSVDEKIEKALFVRLEADLGIGVAWNRSRESLVVYFKAERGGRAEVGADGIGDCDGVKKRWRAPLGWAGPLMVEQNKLIGERGAVGENYTECRPLQADLR